MDMDMGERERMNMRNSMMMGKRMEAEAGEVMHEEGTEEDNRAMEATGMESGYDYWTHEERERREREREANTNSFPGLPRVGEADQRVSFYRFRY